MKNSIICLLFLIGALSPVAAQLAITIDTLNASRNEEIAVNFRVEQFTKIVGLQFSVRWDDEVLKYKEIKNFGSSSISKVSFGGVVNPDDPDPDSTHFFTFLWFDNNLVGEDITDNSILFTVVYEVVGESNTSSDITISPVPLDIEALTVNNQNLVTLDLQTNVGLVNVLSTSTVDYKGHSPPSYSIYPNPIKDHFIFGIEMAEASNMNFVIRDLNGRELHREQRLISSGFQEEYFEINNFKTFGTYLLTVESQQFKLTTLLLYAP